MSDKYLANRLKYHAASRVGAKLADPLLNALNLDGHTVKTTQVWAAPPSLFPVNTGLNKTTTDSTAATNDLVTVFKSGATSQEYAGGNIWTNPAYPAVKLYLNVLMTAVAGSNGSGTNYEAYLIIGSDSKRVQDWVSPMAAFDESNGKPIPGFAGKVLAYKSGSWTLLQNCADVNGVWALSKGNWLFIYRAGIVTFNADYTPTAKGYTKIRWTGFQYVGEYLDSTIEGINERITNAISGGVIDIAEFSGETQARLAADNAITGRLQVLENFKTTVEGTGEGSIAYAVETASGNLAAKDTLILNTIGGSYTTENTVYDAITGLSTNINGNYNTLTGLILTEQLRAVAALEAITASIGTTSDTSGVATVYGNIQKLIDRATAAELLLDAKITAELNARIAALTGVNEDISELSARSITGTSAIVVSEGDSKVVSLKLDGNDKFLSQSADGLKATFTLKKQEVIEADNGIPASSIVSQYYLADKDGNKVNNSALISIYKDQFLKNATYNASTHEITFTFNLADGTTVITPIDLSDLVDVYDGASGITKLSDGTFVGVVDANSLKDGSNLSASYLTVSADGFKLSGIGTEIQRQVAILTNRATSAEETITSLIGTDADTSGVATVYGAIAKETAERLASDAELSLTLTDVITAVTEIQNSIGDGGTIGLDIATAKEDISNIKDYISGTTTGLNDKLSAVSDRVSTALSLIDDLQTVVSSTIPNTYATISALSDEETARTNADNELLSAILSGFNVTSISDIPVSGNLNDVRAEIAQRFTDMNNLLSGVNSDLALLKIKIDALNS